MCAAVTSDGACRREHLIVGVSSYQRTPVLCDVPSPNGNRPPLLPTGRSGGRARGRRVAVGRSDGTIEVEGEAAEEDTTRAQAA